MVIAGWALTGCGSSVSVSGGEPPPEANPPAPEPPVPPPPEPEAPGLCGTPASDPFLAVSDGTEVAIVYGDGSRRRLDAGFDLLPPGEPRLRWILDGERLIILAASRQFQGGIQNHGLISAYDAKGELLFRIDQPGVELSGVATGDDGSFVLSRYASPGQSDYAWVRDGALEVLPEEVTPLTGRYAGRTIRARVNGQAAFYDLETQDTTPVATAVGAVSTVVRGDAWVSLHEGAPPRLWVERPSETTGIDLETVDVPADALQIVSFSGRYLLLHHQDTARTWRVDLEDDDDLPLPVDPPDGGPPPAMSYCRPPPVVGSGGEVLMVGGTEAITFQTFAPETTTWTSLGQPVHSVETTHGIERDGTWVLEGVVGTFCPGPVAPGADGLSGRSTQVVRPGVGAYAFEEDVAVVLRAGGACAGVSAFEGRIEVLDVETGETTRLEGGSFGFWP